MDQGPQQPGFRQAALLRWLVLLAWVAALPAGWCESRTLGTRVQETSRELRELETHYREVQDVAERAKVLRLMLARAAWLEQIGGLKEARADQLLALARWEVLGQQSPPWFSYAAEVSGAPVAELVVRRPKPGELPEALKPLEPTVLLLFIRNTSAHPLQTVEYPWAEYQTTARAARKAPLAKDAARAAAAGLAALFAWPDELAPGKEAHVLALLPDEAATLLEVGLAVREAGREDSPRRVLSAPVLSAADPVGFARAKREAAQLEAEIKAARDRPKTQVTPKVEPKPEPRKVEPKPEPKKIEPKPEPKTTPKDKKPAEDLPVALGTVQLSGGEDLIQVRLDAGVTFSYGEVLRVRKRNEWVGRVQMPLRRPGDPEKPEVKASYIARILDGERSRLGGGTLHRE